MKRIITAFVAGLLAQQIAQAQGTIYLSSLSQTSTGTVSVGSDSWLAALFIAGTNAGGYLLDSVQLGIADATGNPSGFTGMIYNSSVLPGGAPPGSSLATLTGSATPSTAGIYTYTPISSLTLSPSTTYFIVLTAGTTVANGAYEWNLTAPSSYNPSGGWRGGGIFESSDGAQWSYYSYSPQFAITATAIPEPGVLGLLCLGGIFLFRRRRRF